MGPIGTPVPVVNEVYLTVDDAARIVRTSKSTIRRRIKTGTGPRVCRMSGGRLLRIPESALHAWMHSQMSA
jgi:excisionase family DNA binding protein